MNYTKNIKLTFLVAFLTFTYFSTNAQNSYFGFNVGYGIPTKSNKGEWANISSTSEASTLESANIGYGGGLNLAAKFGFGLSEFVAIEVNANYLSGNASTITFSDITPDYSSVQTTTSSSNMFQISPSIVFGSSNNEAVINPYTRFGFTTGFGSIAQTYEIEQIDNLNRNNRIVTSTLNGGMAFGVNAALGANFKLNEKMYLFGEFNLLSLSYAPKKETITAFNINDVDLLPDLPTSAKEIEFYKEVTIDSNDPEDKPRKELAYDRNYSSLGLNFGIKVNLN